MQGLEIGQRPSPQAAGQALQELAGVALFEKVLTASDTRGGGRVVISRKHAEAYFPRISASSTAAELQVLDLWGRAHPLRLKAWSNGDGRMYVLEDVASLLSCYALAAGDRLMFGRLPSGSMVACGMQGAAAGAIAVPMPPPKPAPKQRGQAKRSAVQVPTPAPARQGQQPQQEHSKKRRATAAAPAVAVHAQQHPVTQQAQQVAPAEKVGAPQLVQVGCSYTWSGTPPAVDAVFRALPAGASLLAVPNQVAFSAIHGCYAAVICLGGELFQALFYSECEAQLSLDAALQSCPAPFPAPSLAQPAPSLPLLAAAHPAAALEGGLAPSSFANAWPVEVFGEPLAAQESGMQAGAATAAAASLLLGARAPSISIPSYTQTERRVLRELQRAQTAPAAGLPSPWQGLGKLAAAAELPSPAIEEAAALCSKAQHGTAAQGSFAASDSAGQPGSQEGDDCWQSFLAHPGDSPVWAPATGALPAPASPPAAATTTLHSEGKEQQATPTVAAPPGFASTHLLHTQPSLSSFLSALPLPAPMVDVRPPPLQPNHPGDVPAGALLPAAPPHVPPIPPAAVPLLHALSSQRLSPAEAAAQVQSMLLAALQQQ